ncbi:hypothetical protein [Chelatococcus sp. XZ-Ab1]|uniref:hypothetical protein n=1 Tax=Chelatococcus sp. XZ-Ab1 TaxID=3034027 RepID=UPI0023E4047F|nr:hypothetical protein [Chelatococcus sp. XZ-Ab1]
MPRAAARPSAPPPLLVWDELRQIEQMRFEREQLRQRVARLPLHCHRRIVLQARLEQLTLQLVAAEVALNARPLP